jgi:RsiW-degrading membrane proteinase PrsW (M82 family)
VILLEILVVLLPLALYGLALRRRAREAGPLERPVTLLLVATFALGALAFVPAWFVERWVEDWAGLDEHARSSETAALLYAFFVASPMEQGLKVAAVVPARRSTRFASRADGVLYASAVGLGFVSAHNAVLLGGGSAAPWLDLGRALLAAPAHVFFAAAWGYPLGREAARAGPGGPRHIGGWAFNLTWFGAMLFNGIYDHIVFGRGRAALIAAAPILVAMAVTSVVALRSLRPQSAAPERLSRFSIAPPSIAAVRAALWRTEQPVRVGWIGIGALVTVGVITAALVGAVAVGRRIGVDFASVDRADGGATAAPLALLGGATLAAFPVAGYLISRASATRGVLEAAIAAALAIAGALVLLGLAAPIAVVFALAFAPIALGLACAGAWMGIVR